MATSMFERYGGFAQVSRIVSAFYDRMLSSPATSSYFSGVDMRRLIDHQTKFISTIMGGPASYSGDQLERVHAHIGITDEAFDAAAEMLMEALEEFGIEDADVKEVCAEFVSRKRYIVTKATS